MNPKLKLLPSKITRGESECARLFMEQDKIAIGKTIEQQISRRVSSNDADWKMFVSEIKTIIS
jgi:hypothetical protein